MFHTLIVAGHLGRDPEMRYAPSGTAVTNFSMATSRKYKDSQDNQVEETIWFRVSAWGKLGETCNQYLKSGSKVLVEGRITPDKETGGPRVYTRQDGSSGASYEVTAQVVRFLDSRGDTVSAYAESGPAAPASTSNDDIPF